MALFLIGLGLSDVSDISVKGLELARKAITVYLEDYTGKMQCSVAELEKFLGKKVVIANRELVEQKAEQAILANAGKVDVALLVAGDPLVATTHVDLLLRAEKLGIPVQVIHNASVVSAIGAAGLQVYKFGRTASIPFPEKGYLAETPYDVLAENQKIGAHTLLLLDLRPGENRFMSVNEAIEYLLKVEARRGQQVFTGKTLCVGCARLGSQDQKIRAGSAGDLLKVDFGKPPHCLVVPGKLHFVEEEFLELLCADTRLRVK